jgi:hypothetical protein
VGDDANLGILLLLPPFRFLRNGEHLVCCTLARDALPGRHVSASSTLSLVTYSLYSVSHPSNFTKYLQRCIAARVSSLARDHVRSAIPRAGWGAANFKHLFATNAGVWHPDEASSWPAVPTNLRVVQVLPRVVRQDAVPDRKRNLPSRRRDWGCNHVGANAGHRRDESDSIRPAVQASVRELSVRAAGELTQPGFSACRRCVYYVGPTASTTFTGPSGGHSPDKARPNQLGTPVS